MSIQGVLCAHDKSLLGYCFSNECFEAYNEYEIQGLDSRHRSILGWAGKQSCLFPAAEIRSGKLDPISLQHILELTLRNLDHIFVRLELQ